MLNDASLNPPLRTRRREIDILSELLPKAPKRKRKRLRQRIANAVSAQVATFRSEPVLSNEERGRLANAKYRRNRHVKIAARQAEKAVERGQVERFERGEFKPVIE